MILDLQYTSMTSPYNKLLNFFTVFLVVCTFCLIIAGGLVTSTDSGLSVPDWPLSYGKLMPPMVGGIFFEHGHRMVATFVGFLTVVLLVLVYRKEPRRWLRRLAIVALLAVITQGLLGGLTVLYMLPTWISVSHATLAQTFFAIVSSIALFQTSWWQRGDLQPMQSERGKSVFSLGVVTVGAIYVQLILGALMRHTGSGLAVPDFPLAYGQLFPSLSSGAVDQYNAVLIADNIRLAADGPVTAGQITIHLLHRFWAVLTALLVIVYAVRVARSSTGGRGLLLPAGALLVLIPAQIALGAFTVLSRKAVDITTVHVATGALILVTTVVTTLMVYRLTPHPRTEPAESMAVKEAIA